MSTANILDVVVRQFISTIEAEAQLPPKLVEDLRQLAEEGALADLDRIDALLKERPRPDDQA